MNTEPEITLALEHLHKALSQRLKVLERDLQKVKDDIPAQVEKRKQLALNLKPAAKLLIVYETVAYFHAYEKTPPQPIESLVSNITSTLKPFYLRAHGPYTGSMQETVQFELHQKAYSLEFNKKEDSGWFRDDYSYLAGHHTLSI